MAGTELKAVSLDVGGVLTFPDHGMLAHALKHHGVEFDRARFSDAHYHAMAEVDRALAEPETFGDYTHGFLAAIGVPPAQTETAVAALRPVLVPAVWHQPIPGAVDAARRLKAAGLRLAVTSNADGGVAECLARYQMVQVGPGPGVEVEVITDSGIVGVHKPDPRVFQATADALGLAFSEICHVGDGGRFDAEGANKVGMMGVHVDPLGLCRQDHRHVPSLAAFADQVEAELGLHPFRGDGHDAESPGAAPQEARP